MFRPADKPLFNRLSTGRCVLPSIPGHALHGKGLQRQIGVGTLVSIQERRALLVPLINRWSTARFVPPSVYIGFPSFVPLGPEGNSSIVWRVSGAFFSGRAVLSVSCAARPRPAPPSRRDPPRTTDLPVVCQVLDSTDLHRLSLVRASGEAFRTRVFDALEGTRDGCVLREQTRRRPILPGPPRPAAPACAARPDPPVVCPGFGFDE